MGRVVKYTPLYPWSGGLNTSVDPTILDPQKLVVADNIIFTTSGSRKKRGGQAHYNSVAMSGASSANVVHMVDYWSTVSTAKREYFVAVTDNGKVFRAAPSGTTWSSFSTLTLSVTHGGVTSCVMNEDLILGISGNGVPKVWDNQNTASNLVAMSSSSGTLPFSSAWIVKPFIERLFVAGDPNNPDRLYVSRVGDYRRWTASTTAGTAITLDIGIGDGDPSGITAIFPGTGGDRQLYIAKRRHIYRLDCSNVDQTLWSITLISDQIGCINPNVVATIDMSDVIFASDRGIHTLNQIITSTAIVDGQFLSFPIQEDYKNTINSGIRDRMSAIYAPSLNSYLFSCKRTGQTTFETVYGYNVELKEWFRWTSVPCNFLMLRFNKTTGLEELYACAPNGFVNKLQQTALNDFTTNAIVTRIKSTLISPEGIPFQENQFTNLACIYRSRENSTFRVYYSVDGLVTKNLTFEQKIAGGNILGTTLLGSGFLLGQIQAIKPVWQHLNIDEGNAIQLTIEQDGLNEDFELFGIVIEHETDEEAQNAFRSSLYS